MTVSLRLLYLNHRPRSKSGKNVVSNQNLDETGLGIFKKLLPLGPS